MESCACNQVWVLSCLLLLWLAVLKHQTQVATGRGALMCTPPLTPVHVLIMCSNDMLQSF